MPIRCPCFSMGRSSPRTRRAAFSAATVFTDNKEEQDFIVEKVIGSPEWNTYGLIDSGFITNEEASILINDRTNNIHKELVDTFMK